MKTLFNYKLILLALTISLMSCSTDDSDFVSENSLINAKELIKEENGDVIETHPVTYRYTNYPGECAYDSQTENEDIEVSFSSPLPTDLYLTFWVRTGRHYIFTNFSRFVAAGTRSIILKTSCEIGDNILPCGDSIGTIEKNFNIALTDVRFLNPSESHPFGPVLPSMESYDFRLTRANCNRIDDPQLGDPFQLSGF